MEEAHDSEVTAKLLKEGYEPFSQFREDYYEFESGYTRTVYCFKRLAPCEFCKKMNTDINEMLENLGLK